MAVAKYHTEEITMFKIFKKLFKKPKKEKLEIAKDLVLREFLEREISLTEEKWSERFRNYVKEKYQERLAKVPERSQMEQRRRSFLRYLKGLDLSVEDIKGKRILDLGCGEGEFVKECFDKGISDQVYGLDIELDLKEMEYRYRAHFIDGDFEQKFPMASLDLVVSVGAVEAPSEGKITRNPLKTLKLALDALKPSGEIRIYPMRKAPPGSELPGIEQSQKEWSDILENLSLQQIIDYELRPIDIVVAGKKPDVWLEQVLIIKKKTNRIK